MSLKPNVKFRLSSLRYCAMVSFKSLVRYQFFQLQNGVKILLMISFKLLQRNRIKASFYIFFSFILYTAAYRLAIKELFICLL